MSNMREKIQELAKEYIGDVMCESWVNNLLSLFQSEMEKVIGKNERPKKFAPDWPWNWRNQLRAEQRQKLANLINTIEEGK